MNCCVDLLVEKYDNMIRQQAWVCYRKLPPYARVMWELEDLYQAGVMTILEYFKKCYDSTKSSVTTFIYRILQSVYSNILKRSLVCDYTYIEDQGLNEETHNVNPEKYYSFKESLEKLSDEVKEIVNIALDLPEEIYKNIKKKAKPYSKFKVEQYHIRKHLNIDRKVFKKYVKEIQETVLK